MILAGGLLLGETSGITGAMEEVIEALALIWTHQIPLLESINIKKEKEPPIVTPGVVGVKEERASTSLPVSKAMISEPIVEPLPSVPGVAASYQDMELEPLIPVSGSKAINKEAGVPA